jgi:hypothetical protein
MPTIETVGNADGPVFRLFQESDLQDVLELMEEFKPNIGGARYRSLYHAFCCEALLDQRVVLIVAEELSRLIGFAIAIIDRNRWWVSFMTRHPLITLRIAFVRIFHKLRNLVKKPAHSKKNIEPSESDIENYITTTYSGKSWKDYSPQIAKLLYLAVKEGHRGKNIGGKIEGIYVISSLFISLCAGINSVLFIANIS